MRCRVGCAVQGRPGVGLAARVAGSVAVLVARLWSAWRFGKGWSVLGTAENSVGRGRSSTPSFAYTRGGCTTRRARLQPGWLDRVFRGLLNAGVFVCFGALVAPRGGGAVFLIG